MKENLTYNISSSFNLLGLKPSADARQIRSAFRRLARTHHPDVAGAFNSKKFEQISNAYMLLKSLTPEELSLFVAQIKRPDEKSESFYARWKRKHVEKEAAREEELRTAREAEEAEKEARERVIYDRVELILDRCAREIISIRKKKQNERQNREISDIVIRLLASREEVRLIAIQNMSKYINSPLIMETTLKMLKIYPITGKILDYIDKYQFSSEYMQKIIGIVSDNVGKLSEKEALTFIRKIIFMIADNKSIISKLMEHPSIKIAEFLITRWTFPALPDEVVLKRIFSDIQNEKLIISALSMLKRHDKRIYPHWLVQKIDELQALENTSVKLWARTISSNENVVK